MGRRPEPLDAVHGGPFAQHGQHRPIGPGQLDAQAAAEPPAQGPAAMGEIAGWYSSTRLAVRAWCPVVVTASSTTATFGGSTPASAFHQHASGVMGRASCLRFRSRRNRSALLVHALSPFAGAARCGLPLVLPQSFAPQHRVQLGQARFGIAEDADFDRIVLADLPAASSSRCTSRMCSGMAGRGS